MIADAIARAADNSPFLARIITRRTDLMPMIEAGDFDKALTAALTGEATDMAATLRKRRQGVALVTAIADLSGAWDLHRITRTLSDFADSALEIAIETTITERVPDAPVAGFTAIALGKHGGQELNYSSDIDPIFLFDPKSIPCREHEDPQESAIRIGKRVIELLSNVDENGYVFRVDMRLRPSPEVSPVALPVEAAIGYYESSALAWEQAAFVRARVAAGDRKLGHYFLRSIDSFIWRRSLDFGQLNNIQAMSKQIRDHYAKGQQLGRGFDLKRGRGGIRECEFFAQSHQLIHGGRNPALRIADTVAALSALSDAGWIAPADAEALTRAYILLRTIEHRLQMVNDRQTHSLPDGEEAGNMVARLHGLRSEEELFALLRPHVAEVNRIYDALAGDEDSITHMADGGPPLDDQLADMGFADPASVASRIIRWRSGRLRAIRSGSARDAFEEILPAILRTIALSPDADRAIARFDNLIDALPSAINFFRLLAARPALLQLVGDILSYAPVLADMLGRRVELLDGLIDNSALDLPGGVEVLHATMAEKIAGLDYQDILDQIRIYVGEHRFALGVQLIEGRHDPAAVAQGYARLAEAALQILAEASIAEFERTYGRVPGGELVILALGRLGGGELTHASDLDLILLFTGQFDAESDGEKPLGATQYFNRLAQRVVAAMSVATATGPLYEVDTRLRPSGAQGLLCVSLDSFAKYQRENAWSWEHMALTRARPVFGSATARAELQTIIDGILDKPRDREGLYPDIVKMRADIRQHKPPKGSLDVKLLPGGLIDGEFLVHALQLGGAAKALPRLDDAIGLLIESEALSAEFADAMDLLSRLLVLLRLVAPDCEDPPEPAQRLIARSLDYESWEQSLHAVEKARSIVLESWQRILGQYDSPAILNEQEK